MTKKDKTNLSNILGLGLVLIGIYLWYKSQIGGVVGFFIIFIVASTLPHILISYIVPNKKEQKKKRKNKTKSKTSTLKIEKSPSSTTPKKDHNLLRSENEILTLPLEQLSWREFERLCYLYYKAKGYKPRETPEGADGGVDLIIYNRHHQQDVAIQIKHYIESGKQVTVKEIRELDSSKKNHKCILAEFISSTGYTNTALTEADKKKIKCHTVDKILRWRDQEVLKRELAK